MAKYNFMSEAKQYVRRNTHRRVWKKAVQVMACAVVFVTTYALILPAITMEGNVGCTIPEHTHSEECYAKVLPDKVLICELPEIPEHVHGDSCYAAADEGHTHGEACFAVTAKELICILPEAVGHTHGEGCVDSVLICTDESDEHTHDDSCYETVLTCDLPQEEGHTHTDDCYILAKSLICELPEREASERTLICGLEATHIHNENCGEENCVLDETQVHTHTEDCYVQPDDSNALTCGMEKSDSHSHSERCYGTWKLVCELEEHRHDLACLSDPGADVETAEQWEKSFSGAALNGKWTEDLVSIAGTQLGYTESSKNYIVLDDGYTMKGYTRYGAWYGDPYGDWNAMFASFCVSYAKVENMPLSADCESWIAELVDRFAPAAEHTPESGELVFFDRDGNSAADEVGIVVSVEDSQITMILGDRDNTVKTIVFERDDETVLGYATLPEQHRSFVLTAQTESGILVTISGDRSALPYPAEEITVTAQEVHDEQIQELRSELLNNPEEPKANFLLDISLWHGTEKIEPIGEVTVSFSGVDTEGYYATVYHIDTAAAEATNMNAVKNDSGDVVLKTDHFSFYDLWITEKLIGTGISGEGITNIANGGNYYLTENAYTGNTIYISGNKSVVLDLNGYGVYYKGSDRFIVVEKGSTLTIKDSGASTPSRSIVNTTVYGQSAHIDYDGGGNRVAKLTYYVTESNVNFSSYDVSTTEQVVKYELRPNGIIVGENSGGAANLVWVENGSTFNLEGGLLTIRSSESYGGDCHIIYNEGNLNISGGYVCGGKDHCWGGGIFSKGPVTMTGGVLADNYGNAGGGICVENTSFTMTGGIISGNGVHSGTASPGGFNNGYGGGVFAKNSTVSISGGYITNNVALGYCGDGNRGNGCHGGAGIATIGGSFTMTGGYVTGNNSQEAGGGIYLGHYNVASTSYSISGGTIASNRAQKSEGGGIRIGGSEYSGGGSNGVIYADSGSKVYITNNKTHSDFDWGGGGIFVQKNGTLNLKNALIEDNSAGGYGGGVGACPTGEILIIHTNGMAMFDNFAEGVHMSYGGNYKDQDYWLAHENELFRTHGYQDYFCVRSNEGASQDISLVTGQMIGGGAENWSGTCDDSVVEIGQTGHVAAKFRFGLTANPSSDHQRAARLTATTIITGNSAYTHGGGIMTNGGLILGQKEEVVTSVPALDISGVKMLKMGGRELSSNRDFQFMLKDSGGNVVGTATADAATGKFTITPDAEYNAAGTYTYTLEELNDSRADVTYDTTKYSIRVEIKKDEVTLLGVKFITYYVDSVKVYKGASDNSAETQVPSGNIALHFKNYGNWNNVSLYSWKSGYNNYHGGWPGSAASTDPNNSGWYTVYVPISAYGGAFNFIFNGSGGQTADLWTGDIQEKDEIWITGSDSVTRTAPSGWKTGKSDSAVSITTVKNSDSSYSVKFNQTAFVNETLKPLTIRVVKTGESGQTLSGAVFKLAVQGTATEWTKTTGADGVVSFSGIPRNKVLYLWETKAPQGYMASGPWIIESGSSTATMFPAEEVGGQLKKVQGASGTALSVSDSDEAILCTAVIPNEPLNYEFPATGSAGTLIFSFSGLLVIGWALLGCGFFRKRKGGAGF